VQRVYAWYYGFMARLDETVAHFSITLAHTRAAYDDIVWTRLLYQATLQFLECVNIRKKKN